QPPVSGGARLVAEELRPLPLATTIVPVAGSTATAVGYQPTGRKPSGRLRPGRDTSKTARQLLSAFATTRLRPSRSSATAFGVLPVGARGSTEVTMVSVVRAAATSTTETVLWFAFATKRRAPSGES